MNSPAGLPESARLRERGAATWAAAVTHPMVVAIGSGTLPHETFRFYFEQNVQYLHEYVRAIALTIAAAPDRSSQSLLARFLGQIVDVEIPANLAFLARLGGSAASLPDPLPTTRGYASHLLTTAREGNMAVALAALLPCQWSYGEIGQRLAAGDVPDDLVFADWIAPRPACSTPAHMTRARRRPPPPSTGLRRTSWPSGKWPTLAELPTAPVFDGPADRADCLSRPRGAGP